MFFKNKIDICYNKQSNKQIMIITQNTQLAYLEAKGLAKCLNAYAKDFASEPIFEIGFNENSGYVYIALENINLQIASAFGQDVDYICTDFETGKEIFYESFEDFQKIELNIA